jgi:hypothetical protein
MKIIAQIKKLPEGQYQLNGKVFDSFLGARLEMAQWVNARRQEQKNRRSAISNGLVPPRLGSG